MIFQEVHTLKYSIMFVSNSAEAKRKSFLLSIDPGTLVSQGCPGRKFPTKYQTLPTEQQKYHLLWFWWLEVSKMSRRPCGCRERNCNSLAPRQDMLTTEVTFNSWTDERLFLGGNLKKHFVPSLYLQKTRSKTS